VRAAIRSDPKRHPFRALYRKDYTIKVSVTFEISDEERLVLGIQANGEMAPATRDEMEAAIRTFVDTPLSEGVQALREANRAIIHEFVKANRTSPTE